MTTEDAILQASEHVAKIVALATKFLVPDKDSEEFKDPRRMADAYAAVSVVVSVYNIFASMYAKSNTLGLTAIVDLTFALNANPFWLKHSGYIMPLLNAAVNSTLDFKEQELVDEPVWSELTAHNKAQWLEILPAIIFLSSGYIAMRKYSLEMKKTFAGLI